MLCHGADIGGAWRMATEKKGERPPRDLSVPETMKIAALLAELMPPGTIAQPVPLATKRSEPADDQTAGAFSAPALQIEDLDEFETEAVSPSVVPIGTSPVEPHLASVPPLLPAAPSGPSPLSPVAGSVDGKTPEEADFAASTMEADPTADEAPTIPRLPPTPIPPPINESLPAEPAEIAAGRFLTGLNWANDPSQPPIAATPLPLQSADSSVGSTQERSTDRRPHDVELVPLGDLSAAGFFSLVNWTNDPQGARHPRRADYGLDEQTLSQARKNPFYVVGQPRKPERDSVAELMARISWD